MKAFQGPAARAGVQSVENHRGFWMEGAQYLDLFGCPAISLGRPADVLFPKTR